MPDTGPGFPKEKKTARNAEISFPYSEIPAKKGGKMSVLKVIKDRRSVRRYRPDPIPE
jgi:hypothetical protein